jgi:hypothetical protein
MAYGVAIDIPGPPELYHAMHAEFLKYPAEEMVLHVARPSAEVTQVIEVWTSEEAQLSWMAANVGPVIGAVTAAGWTVPELVPASFEPAGLIVTAAGVAG